MAEAICRVQLNGGDPNLDRAWTEAEGRIAALEQALRQIADWKKYTAPAQLSEGDGDTYECGANDTIDTLAEIARAALAAWRKEHPPTTGSGD